MTIVACIFIVIGILTTLNIIIHDNRRLHIYCTMYVDNGATEQRRVLGALCASVLSLFYIFMFAIVEAVSLLLLRPLFILLSCKMVQLNELLFLVLLLPPLPPTPSPPPTIFS